MPTREYFFTISNAQDILFNIAGFVPLGFLLTTLFPPDRRTSRKRNLIISIVIGTALSLAIELPQAYLPTRDSSMTDLICNSLGTLLGALLTLKALNGRNAAVHGARGLCGG